MNKIFHTQIVFRFLIFTFFLTIVALAPVKHANAQTSGWIDGGAAVYLQTSSDNVGIGTTKPIYKLDISGTLRTTGTAKITSTLTAANGLTLTTGALNLTSTSGLINLTLGSSANAFKINGGLFLIDTLNGKVNIGVGPSAPINVLDATGLTTKKLSIYGGTASSASIGTGTLAARQAQTTISTSSVTSNSLVFITPASQTTSPLYVASTLPGTSFTIGIGSTQPQGINFNWWVVDKNNTQ